MKSSSKFFIFIFFIFLLFQSCATTTLSSIEEDKVAKEFSTISDKSNLYIVRDNKFFGAAISFQVITDGKYVGNITPGSYYLLQLIPGEHTVAVTSNENSIQKKVILYENTNSFIEVLPKWGAVSARVSIEPLSLDRGKQLVTEANKAESMTY